MGLLTASNPTKYSSLSGSHNQVESFTQSPFKIGFSQVASNSGGGGESAPCLSRYGLNYNDILDCANKFPKYKNYFKEKIYKIERMEFLIKNPSQRVPGETRVFLEHWQKHFATQIKNVLSWLLKKKE